MRTKLKLILAFLATVFLLSGCMRTVDQMYRLPKRSEMFTELQSAVDNAMPDLSYCAPTSGENQQAVQHADLNGDGKEEFLLFAKADAEHPLRILIFQQLDDTFDLVQSIESNGAAFDSVEYANMDGKPGSELIFGSQLSDQVLKNVSVYTFSEALETQLLVSANYSKYLCTDLDSNGSSELFVLKPGLAANDNGLAELYSMRDGKIERTTEINMSGPTEKLKRILIGKIAGGIPAVYVATTVSDSALVTDIYIYQNGNLRNIALSKDSDASVRTLRNYYIFADDIDNDDVVELPYLMPMMPMDNMVSAGKQELIRWYALDADSNEITKAYTFHNFIDGWYLELDEEWAAQLTVLDVDNTYAFYIWDHDYINAEKVLTIYAHSGNDRGSENMDTEHILLAESENVWYTAKIEEANNHKLSPEYIRTHFRLISQAWKTGET